MVDNFKIDVGSLDTSEQSTFRTEVASLASGSAALAAQIDNTTNKFPAAWLKINLTTGTSPTNGNKIEIYVVNAMGGNPGSPHGASYGSNATNWVTSNGAWTLLGDEVPIDTITVDGTSNKEYSVVIPTEFIGPLGTTWGIVINNQTGAALNATGSNHDFQFQGYFPTKETV